GPTAVQPPQSPNAHVSVPAVHSPRSVPQPRVSSSSIARSQSLSKPSQISGSTTQVSHTPPSSIGPSQSSSTPLHTSTGGAPQVPHALRRPSSIAPSQLSSTPSQTVSPGSAQRLGVVTMAGT